jgi:hypothetical protein
MARFPKKNERAAGQRDENSPEADNVKSRE